jgi:hypothetical protein
MPNFHGESTLVLENGSLRVEYLPESARIVHLSTKDGPNLLADLGLTPLPTPYGEFFFRGGHRLWHAPEAMPRTYVPDNSGGLMSQLDDGVRIEMPTETWSHVAKVIEIHLDSKSARAIVRHELRNDGAWAIEFAPWALTMLRLGGTAIFPQPAEKVDQAGLLPNRRFSLWPYSRIGDPRLHLRDDYVIIHATPSLPPLKLGYFNPSGWMAYWLDGVLFSKHFDASADASYPDYGCNAETFCNDKFIELESLGPLHRIDPGKSVVHSETWELHETLEVPFLPREVQESIRSMQ